MTHLLTEAEPSALMGVEENTRAFAAWADAYDAQPNPLLLLEERYLSRLLPKMHGQDVLDAGCGTGRWLERLAAQSPKSLRGIDNSAAMLRVAARKHIRGAHLFQDDGIGSFICDESMDTVLSSFVVSYVFDLESFAKHAARALRSGGHLFITDMHPETARQLRWKRTASSLTESVELHVAQRGMQEIIQCFMRFGFLVRAFIEPCFGEAEKQVFASADKLASFDEAAGLPAIYILHLQKANEAAEKDVSLSLCGASCVFGAEENAQADIQIADGHIQSMKSHAANRIAEAKQIDVSGYRIFPGLMNAHDHLEFALFPRMGKGVYRNAREWAYDIQETGEEIIADHKRVPMRTRLWWGAIRNLLCGVTTVCHHNPIEELQKESEFPIRFVSRFRWKHSPWLNSDADIAADSAASGENEPFILHACEGVDEEAAAELQKLEDAGALRSNTILVHGLAMNEQQAAQLNAHGTALVVCPSSNDFLFSTTPSVAFLAEVRNLALGSDSALTAVGDLLDEVRFTSQVCGLDDEMLFGMVTDSSASMLRLVDGEGALRPFAGADIFAVRERTGTSAEVLTTLDWKDIELVLVGGQVKLASDEIMHRLPLEKQEGLKPLEIDGVRRWLRAPVESLLRDAENVLGKDCVQLNGRLLRSVSEVNPWK